MHKKKEFKAPQQIKETLCRRLSETNTYTHGVIFYNLDNMQNDLAKNNASVPHRCGDFD
jgi:hypothetical protein